MLSCGNCPLSHRIHRDYEDEDGPGFPVVVLSCPYDDSIHHERYTCEHPVQFKEGIRKEAERHELIARDYRKKYGV